MLGRNSYSREEFEHARSSLDTQVSAYADLVKRLSAQAPDTKVESSLTAFEGLFFNNLLLVLDRYFVHRIRSVAGKGGSPLNEVELICESLMNNNGIFRASNVIRYIPDDSVVRLNIGDQIRLSVGEFERLSSTFFDELERKFLS